MVALPKEPHFNYELGADIWYFMGRPVLHVICPFTRLRHCDVLKNKFAADVSHSLLHWFRFVAVHGSRQKN